MSLLTVLLIYPPSHRMPPEDWDMLFAAVTERLRGIASGTDLVSMRAAIDECIQDLSMLRSAMHPRRQHPRRIEMETALQQARGELAALQISTRDRPTTTLDRSGSITVRMTA